MGDDHVLYITTEVTKFVIPIVLFKNDRNALCASYGTTEQRQSEHKPADRREKGGHVLGVAYATLLSRVLILTILGIFDC